MASQSGIDIFGGAYVVGTVGAAQDVAKRHVDDTAIVRIGEAREVGKALRLEGSLLSTSAPSTVDGLSAFFPDW